MYYSGDVFVSVIAREYVSFVHTMGVNPLELCLHEQTQIAIVVNAAWQMAMGSQQFIS